MTTIDPTASAASAAAASSSATSSSTADDATAATLGYNDFLKLLLAQMQNQDPLKPMDSTEYVSQLATFSNVEQGIKQNSKLDQLLVISNIAQANAIVGRSIVSADGSVYGQVDYVKILSTGATAYLTNGQQVDLGAGVTIGG